MTTTIIITIVALVTVVFGVLVKVLLKSKLEDWARVGTIIAGLATAVALPWAAYTFDQSARLQRELAAASLYQEHMKLSMEKPELANAKLAPKQPNEDSPNTDREKYEEYQWYVGHALYSFESILEALPNDEGWKSTFKAFIEDHKEYIGSNDFPCTRYSYRLQQLVKEQIGRDCSK